MDSFTLAIKNLPLLHTIGIWKMEVEFADKYIFCRLDVDIKKKQQQPNPGFHS